MLRQSCNVGIGYIYRYLKLSVLWLHILFSFVNACGSCTVWSGTSDTIYVTNINIVTLAKHKPRAA